MRILLAFIITVIIYILLIVVYIYYFNSIKIIQKKPKDEHIIKIDIRDIPKYVKTIEPKVVKAKPSTRELKKEVLKKVVEKKQIKKNIIKKIEKKSPKKIEIKTPTPIVIEEEIVESLPEIIEVEEEVMIAEPIYTEPIIYYEESVGEVTMEESLVEEEYIEYSMPEEPMESVEMSDMIAQEEMLYIPNPMITTPSPTTSIKKEESLSSLLGQSSSNDISNLPKSPLIQKLYGTSFDSFTPMQKKFIVDKLGSIHRITQNTLTRRGYPAGAVAMQTGQEGENIISFDLHPNGDISNLRLEQETGYRALDENTLQTIKIAYKDYPYPTETTHIVFYVEYSIFGY